MSLAVVDASVLVSFYSFDDPRRQEVTERLAAGDALCAPVHLDVEVVSALRGLAREDAALEQSVPAALVHLTGFPVRRMALSPLLERVWELRHNITAYDAAYVALAERLGAALITCDQPLANATGPRCRFDIIGGPS